MIGFLDGVASTLGVRGWDWLSWRDSEGGTIPLGGNRLCEGMVGHDVQSSHGVGASHFFYPPNGFYTCPELLWRT